MWAIVIAVAAVVVVLLVVIGLAVFCCTKSQPPLPDPSEVSRTRVELTPGPAFAPVQKASMIPFDQLILGPIIASGGQGQVRKGEFSGKAVAIKELMAVMFDPKATAALQASANLVLLAWLHA